MQLYAHRGLHHKSTENTLQAFKDAVAAGCDGIETDVRSTADDVAILMHDRQLPDGSLVSQLDFAELQQRLDYPLARLDEALAANLPCNWNIEIKTEAAWQLACPILQKFNHPERLLISSFHHDIVLSAAQAGFRGGLLNAHRPAAINSLIHAALPYPRLRHLIWDFEVLDQQICAQANAIGFHNWVYGANTPEEIRLCQDYGIQVLITDYPENAR
jgi:glycerophosphoryl diester phosphodiesterase